MPKFHCHESASKRSDVQEQFDAATPTMQANFIAALEYLADQPRANWTRPKAAKLTKVEKSGFRDYFEIRFKAEGVQQRPIGYFGPLENQFTILIWATEKGSKFVPSDWRKTADIRRIAISEGKDNVKPLKLEIKQDRKTAK